MKGTTLRNRASFATVLGLVVGVLVTLVSPTAAGAAVARPSVPDYGSKIDAPAAYDPADTCQPALKPGVLAIESLISVTHPSQARFAGQRSCSGSSEHNEGRALDWMVDARSSDQKLIADTFIAWLQAKDRYGNDFAMARRLGVMYIIWNSRMWRAYAPAKGWTDYNGCQSKYTGSAYDTMCHRDHVHLSLSWDGAFERTSYYRSARTAGATAAGTAVAIARTHDSQATTVVIASAEPDNLVDGLVAAPYAASLGAPVLLTARDSLTSATRGEILRRKATIAHVVGGSLAVSDAVVAQLRNLGLTVDRVQGATRFDTAAAVAARLGPSDEVFLASAERGHMVDALAAGGVASKLQRPILLTLRDSLPSATRRALSGVARTTVLGGTLAVSEPVVQAVPGGVRLAGETAAATAVEISDAFAAQLGTQRAFVASSTEGHMIDALPAGVAGRPILLTGAGSLSAPTSNWLKTRGTEEVDVLGGPVAVPPAAVQGVDEAVRP